MTLQEIQLLEALAQRMGWELNDTPKGTYTNKPTTFYRVVDKTHGIDVDISFERSVLMEAKRASGDGYVPIWWVRFKAWNPLESLDDAWELVEAMAQDDQARMVFVFAAPSVSVYMPRREVARGICLAAAKAWGIQTELTS